MMMQGRHVIHRPQISARLLHALSKSPERRHYVRAHAVYENGDWTVNAVEAQGSNIIHSMVRANSLIIFPEYETALEAESRVRVLLLDNESALLGGVSPGEGPGALMAKVEGARG